MGRGRRVENAVPCQGCNECCRGELIFIHPELGDRASDYETKVVHGRYALKQQRNGDCIYLDRVFGCRIHSARPAVCAELDCVVLLAMAPALQARLLNSGRLRLSQLRAAERRLARDPNPDKLLARFQEKTERARVARTQKQEKGRGHKK